MLQPAVEGPSEAPLDSERPVRSERVPSAAAQQEAAWAGERRRLQLHTGLSGGFAGAMVVMGTQGRRGFAHLLLGSVTEKVVRMSQAPVLTVHAPKKDNPRA